MCLINSVCVECVCVCVCLCVCLCMLNVFACVCFGKEVPIMEVLTIFYVSDFDERTLRWLLMECQGLT